MSRYRKLSAQLEDVSDQAREHLSKVEMENSSLHHYCQVLQHRLTEKSDHEKTLAAYVRKLEGLVASASR